MNSSFNKTNPNTTYNLSKVDDSNYRPSPRPNKVSANTRVVGDERIEEEVYAINS